MVSWICYSSHISSPPSNICVLLFAAPKKADCCMKPSICANYSSLYCEISLSHETSPSIGKLAAFHHWFIRCITYLIFEVSNIVD